MRKWEAEKIEEAWITLEEIANILELRQEDTDKFWDALSNLWEVLNVYYKHKKYIKDRAIKRNLT